MTKIVFFSGTGNSYFVAKQLSTKILDSKLFSVIDLLQDKTTAEPGMKLVIVYPTYLTTIPLPIRIYLKNLNIENIEYIAAITTCENKGNFSYITINKILRKSKCQLDYYDEVLMPQNSPTGIKPGKGDHDWTNKISTGNIQKLYNDSMVKIEQIVTDLQKKEIKLPKENIGKNILESIISLLTKNNSTQLKFYTDASCNFCGKCSFICPSKRIAQSNGTILWDKRIKCYYCFACFNVCPKQAIFLKNYKLKTGRYFNKNVSYDEIIRGTST